MCTRYNLISPPEAVRRAFGLASIDDFPERWNIAPSEPVAIVRQGFRGSRELALVRWGLIPSWVKDPRERGPFLNARLETAADKPSFRGAMRHRRCLIPANGFYEWSGPRGGRTAWLVRRHDGGLLAFAGLWEHWLGADGSEVETMAVLTRPATRSLVHVHDRMPAMVVSDAFDAWLDCRSGSAVGIENLIALPPDDFLEAIEIGPRVNDPRNKGPDVAEPLRRTLL
jgi:putative SOS response-associated peptidase YedK